MLSRISKMSVFGLAALLLAFAFTGSDALAAPGTATVTVTTSPADINAGASVDITIVIAITRAATEGDNVASRITVPIPADWHSALHHPGALTADSKAGDTSKDETGGLVGEIYARSLVAIVPKDTASGSITFVYRSPAPKIAKVYTWSVSSPRHTVTLSPDPLVITVGSAADGSGTVALARTNGALLKQGAPDDAVLPYEGRYVTFFNEAMVLKVTYTPAGTMPENSQVVLTIGGTAPNELASFTRLNDSTEVAVTGHVKTITRTADTVTAVVGAGGIGHTRPIVFTINNAKTPNPDPVTTVVTIDDAISLTSAIDADGAGDGPLGSPTNVADGGPFNFTITRKPPFGKATIGTGAAAPTPGTDSINLIAGANIGAADAAAADDKIWFVFTESDFPGMSRGSTYEIDIPAGWPEPFAPITGTAGETQDGASPGEFTGRTLKGTLLGPADADVFAGGTRSLQVNKVPAEQKTYTFPVRAKLGPHTMMMPIGSPKVEVTVGHGTGTLSVARADNTPLTQTTGKAPLGNLVIIYKAAGRMLSGGQVTVNVPAGWQAFRDDNGDAVATPGEVSLTGKATLDLPTTDTSQAIANINAEMAAGEELRFLYKNITVPNVASGTATFAAKASAFGGAANLAPADPNNIVHHIGIGRAPDGGGTLAVAPTNADAGSTIDITLTYSAEGAMIAGSQVKVTLPTNGTWPSPVGKTSVSTGTLTTDATSMTATTSTDLAANDKVVFTYSGVEVPASAGLYEFTAQSKAHPTDGTLTGLSAGATIEIDEVAAGSIALMNAMGEAVTSASPGMTLGNLSFVFTAEEDMAAGAQVTVQIMDGWPRPFVGNNAADSRSGAVWADGATLSIDPAEGQVGPWTITMTLGAAIADGGSLTLTYMDVNAPEAEDVYGFATRASLVSGGTLLEVRPSPSVVVRNPITALAAMVDNASVFVDESIELTVTLWDSDGEGAATGAMEITLSDGDAGGTFDPASITIADTGHSGTSTYTNDTAGEITLTASHGDLDDATVDVEVKSGITGKSVDPDPASAGTDVMISATGGAEAAATLKLSYTNADGNTVTINKGLDPVGDAVDGSQEYTRMITLPSDIPEGDHMVTLTIAGRSDTVSFEVLNDQAKPMLSDASVLPATVENGDVITLSVKAVSSSERNPIVSVMADVSALDSMQTDMVQLGLQQGTDSTYIAVHTISMGNTNADDAVDVTFTATDQIGGEGTATASVTLANDPSVLTDITVPSDEFRPGDTVTITATGTAGQSVKFTVTSSDGTAMPSDKAMDEGPDGTYTGTFDVVADVHTEGMYDVTVTMNDNAAKSMTGTLSIGPAGYMFTLSIPAGTHAIHIPLAVNMINGEEGTIETVGDVYDALGDAVNFIITLGADGSWMSYLGDESAGSMADAAIGDDTGLIAVMKSAATLQLFGDALGTGGVSQVSITTGNNLVGVPLDPAVDMMISDALVAGVAAIAVSNAAGDGFHTITAAGDMGDGPVEGGVGYIVVVTEETDNIPIVGSAWENEGAAAAPAVVFSGSQTPVLHVDGGVMDEFGMLSRIPELRVTVKNLSTGASLDTVLGTEEAKTAYSATFVEFGRHAAKAGDVLEITAHSPNPYVGVRPVPQIVVSADEVLTSRLELPDLELYEIPSETELLANFPNPFNPETWIPYRLAKAAEVTLSIYDTNGRLVRSIDVGFKPAAVYESRASAIYWDGRNNYGERVASGTYFYHLTAGDDYASTRRMVILK